MLIKVLLVIGLLFLLFHMLGIAGFFLAIALNHLIWAVLVVVLLYLVFNMGKKNG